MFVLIVVAALLMQPITLSPPRGYTVSDPARPDQLLLALDDGRYALELGPGCEDIAPDTNVEWLPGSGGVGAIRPLGSHALCNVYLGPRQSDEPCATDDAGECDVAVELGG